MASLEQRSGQFRVVFRYGGQKFSRSLKTRDETAATASVARLEDNLRRMELGLLEAPEGVDLAAFLLSDGRLKAKVILPAIRTLKQLCTGYFDALPAGSLEETTIQGMRIHERQLYRILGESFPIRQLAAADLQKYIEQRSTEKGRRGRKVTPITIKKAIVTLRTVWNWGVKCGHLQGKFPIGGLKYPKAAERPPFQTWKEIEQQIARGGLSDAEQADLWDCLFLTLPEIGELLGYVELHAKQPFIYPMFCFAAHTGARRSEIARSRLSDVDLSTGVATIRERKRNHTMSTTRRVPISPSLMGVLKTWFAKHPGGHSTFCQVAEVPHSKKDRTASEAVTPDEAHDHFKRTLAGSKWSVLRGWHTFRHSFCSNCAAKGVDQRIINAWVGHQTEDMVRRYRHLFPDQQQAAIAAVFGMEN